MVVQKVHGIPVISAMLPVDWGGLSNRNCFVQHKCVIWFKMLNALFISFIVYSVLRSLFKLALQVGF